MKIGKKILNSKALFAFLILLAVLLIILALWFKANLKKNNPDAPSRYSAVYLSTGDIYFGDLNRFPNLHLRSAWFLERSVDPATGQTNFVLSPLRSTFWNSTGWMNINHSEVVWTSPIKNSSPIVGVLEGTAEFSNVSIPGGEAPFSPDLGPEQN